MANRIKIACRLRPTLPHEAPEAAINITPSTISVPSARDAAHFTKFSFVAQSSPERFLAVADALSFSFLNRLDSCYGQNETSEAIFERDVKPLVDDVYSGVVRFAFHFKFNKDNLYSTSI